MNINQLSKEVASFIKNTNEFKAMNKSKLELDKNRNLKRQFDMYINKKNNLYSNYSLEDASKKVNQLNRDYNDFFNLPVVSNYIQKTKEFNNMMENFYKLIEKELLKEDINYYKLTGKTNVNERVELVEDFNQNENVKVFLISLKAGGTGLNLTGADMVIHYDPWWNISAENQATDRAYRIGQKNNVQVYKLITKNSIEEKIYELQEKKSKLIDNVLNTETTFINKLSKDEIIRLFE